MRSIGREEPTIYVLHVWWNLKDLFEVVLFLLLKGG